MWEAIELSKWKDTPCISGRPATEEDIENGIAVFAIPSGSSVHSINLPACVIQIEEETGNRLPGIIIQAEEANDDVYLGIRYIAGGNGVCAIGEADILVEPNSEFGL